MTIREQQNQDNQQQKISYYLDQAKTKKETKDYKDTITQKKPIETQIKSPKFSARIRKQNPFFRLIDRHYGSFKTKILGNYSKIFNCLALKELKPLGRNKTGAKRKILFTPYSTAIIYSNGTVEIKPARKKGLDPDELQADFFRKAKACCQELESMGLALAPLKMNRSPKYGYWDETASIVKQECETQFRKMDKTPDPSSVDNSSAGACKRDLRLSGQQNLELAKARLENPELLGSIEQKMGFIIDTNAAFAENLRLHLKVLRGMECSLKQVRSSDKPFSVSLKNSFTVKGVS